MKKKLLIYASVLLVLGLITGIIGCKAAPTTTPSPSPSPAPTASPAPAPKPSPSPSPSPTASPAPKPSPTTAPAPAQPKVIRWKGQSVMAIGLPPFKQIKYPPWTSGVMYWRDWVEKATQGRLVIDIAPPGSIVSAADMLGAVRDGLLDFGGVYFGSYAVGVIPEADVETGLPFAWETNADAWDAFMNLGLYEEFKTIYAEHNVRWFPVPNDNDYGLFANFPADTVASIKGKKIRAGGVYGDYVTKLGASGTPIIPGPEMYMAFKLGTIDGAIIGLGSLNDMNLWDTVKDFVMEPNLTPTISNLIINMNKWKALPDDIKEMLDRDGPAIAWATSHNVRAAGQMLMAKGKKEYGIRFLKWSGNDAATARAAGFATWDKIAAKSPRTKRLVDKVREQVALYGRITG